MKRVSAGRMRMLCGLAVVCLAGLGPWAVPARAATYVVSLKYGAAPGCPDVTDFKAAVIARLGYDPFNDDAPDRVLVQIRPRGASLDGRIEWHDAQGQWAGDQRFPLGRTNCQQLVRAMAFALALQIQFLAKSEAPPPPPPAAATTTEKREPAGPPTAAPVPTETLPPPVIGPSPEPPAPAAVAIVTAPPPQAGPVLAFGAGAAVGAGMSASPVVLGRAFGAFAWPRLAVELALVTSVPSVARRADGAGISQQYFFANAAACGTRSRWKACLLVNAGAVRLLGRDIDRTTSAVVPLVEAGARIGVVQNLGTRVFLDAHVDGVMRLARWIGRLDQVPVWSAPPIAATVGVDAGIRFP